MNCLTFVLFIIITHSKNVDSRTEPISELIVPVCAVPGLICLISSDVPACIGLVCGLQFYGSKIEFDCCRALCEGQHHGDLRRHESDRCLLMKSTAFCGCKKSPLLESHCSLCCFELRGCLPASTVCNHVYPCLCTVCGLTVFYNFGVSDVSGHWPCVCFDTMRGLGDTYKRR